MSIDVSSNNITEEKETKGSPHRGWFSGKIRITLLKWNMGFFVCAALLFVIAGLRYFAAYSLPADFLGVSYTVAAFASHFASMALISWAILILPLTLILPYKKVIIPFSILLVSIILTLVLLDSQIYTSHRFHFTLLTIRILGWKTWGFGIFYVLIFILLNSFIAKIVWNRIIVLRKKNFFVLFTSLTIVLLLFTHITHIWADAVGYLPVTRFTTTLPLFYPSTDKRFMVKHGFADISSRRDLPHNLSTKNSDFYYPLAPLRYDSSVNKNNILLIGIDALRNDAFNPELCPNIYKYAIDTGIIFTNHWSGGNSTKMGLFSLFYGIPPTYQQYVESNKRSPVLIDRFLDQKYAAGIFTSYKLYAPACLDVTAFVKIPDLRLETKIPGSQDVYRKDSAITAEWKSWLDNKSPAQPFFSFLFYDCLSVEGFPPSYADRVKTNEQMDKYQKKFEHYKVGVQYIDSLIGTVLDDLYKRDLMKNTIVIITSDHGEEYDDNKLGFSGHGSAFSSYQLRIPLIVFWPGKDNSIIEKRTSHYDIIATLMKDALGCINKESDYCSGNNLFSGNQWNWLITGSYYNFAIVEPQHVIVQYPGGYYEMRDNSYNVVSRNPSANVALALSEMGRFFRK